MPVARCSCGAKYKVQDDWAGRKARCKKCGAVFRIPSTRAGATHPADDLDLKTMARAESAAAQVDAEAPAETASSSMFDESGASTAYEPDAAPRVSHLPRVRPHTGFWSDVGWTLLFFVTPGNLLMFMVVWLLSIGAAFLGCIGYLIHVIIIAWYMSIIAETASGEDDLPTFSLSEGLAEDILIPALHYALTWVFLFAPAFVYAVVAAAILPGFALASPAGADPFALLASAGATAPLVALVLLALFLWPAALMCVSMGGLGSLLRVDLIIRAVFKTFLPYLLIVVLVGAADMAPGWILAATGVKLAGGIGVGNIAAIIRSFLIYVIIAAAVEVYFSILVMRLIGLYYRHYKNRFPWDWE